MMAIRTTMTATNPRIFLPVGFIYRVLSKVEPRKGRASTDRLRKSDSTSEIIQQPWTHCRGKSMQVNPRKIVQAQLANCGVSIHFVTFLIVRASDLERHR